MSGAGSLDRRIVIQRATVSRNALNEHIETWATLATRWANRRDVSAGEAYKAQEVGAEITARFTVRYDSLTATITPADRVVSDGEVYNITQARDVRQRDRWIELDAVRRADEAAQVVFALEAGAGSFAASGQDAGFTP